MGDLLLQLMKEVLLFVLVDCVQRCDLLGDVSERANLLGCQLLVLSLLLLDAVLFGEQIAGEVHLWRRILFEFHGRFELD